MGHAAKIIPFIDLEGEKRKLTFMEHDFCEAYLQNRGYAIDALHEAGYKAKNPKVAYAMANQLLLRDDIVAYLMTRLDDLGYNEANVRSQHTFLMNQFGDLTNKAKGVDMFYKVKGSYAAQKVKIEETFDDYTDDEIEDELAKRVAVAGKRRNAQPGLGIPKKK